ncbi:phage tail spike protein [Paenibacillus radicis (ex Xue et al. 2023)]|uniref:Phage tail protein n=1 Tax=Paenibacillus radicis (ex Xue et al. 2023) TaxID=2972489 RepID=A0ABT1YRD0_9BACL|nr:phage tail spike protein [Paenibacillus radicis (ex Xue et al. 2023)]MCR8635739.1 phage tail protein [Paenibacillus radicis (ex Xue et al. 2023)]
MPNAPITVYDNQMRRVAYLENAFAIGYEMPLNGLWTASFSLPGNDPKNKECQPLYFVELYDDKERVELFRIIPNTARRSNDGQTVSYSCEHVLATLLDDVMFQYHTIGNLGVYTASVLQYILSKQLVQRWQLGTVSFNHQFEYNWENENLLAAVISVPKPFAEEFQWTYDTTVYPWRLNLVQPSEDVETYIRYGVNMRGIEKTVDPTNICTRMYGLGYGEGVNQLTFQDINGGLSYVEDTAAQAQYGIVSRIFVDRRYQFSETLKSRCEALLNEYKRPRVSYKVSASDIHRLTGQRIYKFKTGSIVRVKDEEMGEDFKARVVKVSKNDLRGAPGDIQLEIANKTLDIAGTMSDLANRQRIGEVYAQGATNVDSHDFADNCDQAHPAVLRFYIPEETARINKVRLSYKSEAFRAYSRAIEGGGAIATSTAGGGGIATSTAAGGGIATSTAAGGSSTQTSSSGGGVNTSTDSGGGTVSTSTDGNWVRNASRSLPVIAASGNHSHDVPTADGTYFTTFDGNHEHNLIAVHSHDVSVPNHRHDFSVPNHTHNINLPDHQHNVSLPDHSHNVSLPNHAHDFELPNHSHGIDYGIFEGPSPTLVTVAVDGVTIPNLGTSEDEIDLIPFLAKDGAGKIQRGWREIKITPNSLGRIVATVNTQLFVQSRGGGDF